MRKDDERRLTIPKSAEKAKSLPAFEIKSVVIPDDELELEVVGEKVIGRIESRQDDKVIKSIAPGVDVVEPGAETEILLVAQTLRLKRRSRSKPNLPFLP